MPGWTLIETHPTKGRTFRRPLGAAERGFFWRASFTNGTSDMIDYTQLRLVNASPDVHLFSDANIIKAWLSTKRRHPLAGATVQILQGVQTIPERLEVTDSKAEDGGDSTTLTPASVPHFFVHEHELAALRPQEIVFGQVACAGEVRQRMAAIWDNPRPLSNELLAQLYVFREADSQVLHLMMLIAHYVADLTANKSFMRCLLDTLARGGEPVSDPPQLPLEERLAMVISTSDLEPIHLRSLSLARKRWRRAIGSVMYGLRMAKARAPGGHTLPCRLTRATPHIPARSRLVSTLLTEAQTTTVIANCRLNDLTFGCAYLALAQVAMTRVLYRRYLRGEISKEEWEYRKRQRYQIAGPLNLRPYLDKPWLERGGGGELMTCASVFFCTLPFMTLGETERRQYDEHDLSDGAPPFSDLLTFERFLHRAGSVKKQIKAFLTHPLFLEFIRTFSREIARRHQHRALQGTKHAGATNDSPTHEESDDDLNKVLAVTEMGSVVPHGGSSLGNLNLISPAEYPLLASHPLSPFSSVPHSSRAGYVTPPALEANTTQKIVVENAVIDLHVCPADLYLGALTSRGRMDIWVSYDRNVYEEEVVKEWLDEVRGAVLLYLGQTHSSRREQSGPDVAPRA